MLQPDSLSNQLMCQKAGLYNLPKTLLGAVDLAFVSDRMLELV